MISAFCSTLHAGIVCVCVWLWLECEHVCAITVRISFVETAARVAAIPGVMVMIITLTQLNVPCRIGTSYMIFPRAQDSI